VGKLGQRAAGRVLEPALAGLGGSHLQPNQTVPLVIADQDRATISSIGWQGGGHGTGAFRLSTIGVCTKTEMDVDRTYLETTDVDVAGWWVERCQGLSAAPTASGAG
jgi:hypothetical protein